MFVLGVASFSNRLIDQCTSSVLFVSERGGEQERQIYFSNMKNSSIKVSYYLIYL